MKRSVLMGAAMALLVACNGADRDARGGDITGQAADVEATEAADVMPLLRGPWTDLAHRLVEARTLDASVAATREILARGGVATFDGERVLVKPIGPAATFAASPLETVHLAMEARRRAHAGRLTIAELAQMLEGFGWPFRNANPDAAAQRWVEAGDVVGDEDGAADDDSVEAARQAAAARDAALVAQLQDAIAEWQRMRQAAAKAPVAERAAAQERVKQAWDVRTALIAQRRDAQSQADGDRRAARERRIAEQEQRDRTRAALRRVGADHVAGEELMAVLDDWVREAASAPDDPRSFTPLFLAEMARLQDAPVALPGSHWTRPGRGDGPPVHLRGPPRSQQLRWTLLELQLFGAAFERGRSAGPAAAVSSGLDRTVDAITDALLPAAHAGNACIDYKDAYGDDGGEVMGALGAWGVGKVLERASADLGKALGAVAVATRIAKLASFYANEQVSVTAQPASVHKPRGEHDWGVFTARAGVSQDEWDEYRKAAGEAAKGDTFARDCMASLGLPRFNDVVDMAKESEDWLVEWKLTDGAGHAMEATGKENNFAFPGRRAMKMHRESPTNSRADFFIWVLPEEEHTGTVVRTYATAEARVDAAGMPSLGTLVTGGAGGLGLADALLELFSGWFQFVNMPKAYGTIEIEYHCPRPTTLHRNPGKPVADGGGDEGPNECLIAAGKPG